MIKILRIDDRLIHGQVAMAWTKNVGADCIIVVDDNSANDKMKTMILTLAKPAGTQLEIITLQDFKKVFEKLQNKSLMVVTGSVENAEKILEYLGKNKPKSINLGGLRFGTGKEKITESISVTSDDKESLHRINETGIKIVIQATPTSKEKIYKG